MRPGPYFHPDKNNGNMPFYRHGLRFFRCFAYLCKVKHSPDMADIMTNEERSIRMSRIHSASTKPELKLRHALWSHGFRYRVNEKKLPGTPASGMATKVVPQATYPKPTLTSGQRRLLETRNAIKKSGEN